MEYRWHNEWLYIEYRFKYALKEVMALKLLWQSLSNTTKLYMLDSLHIEVWVSKSCNSRAIQVLEHIWQNINTDQHGSTSPFSILEWRSYRLSGSVHWWLFAATLCIPTIQITHPSRWQGAHICNHGQVIFTTKLIFARFTSSTEYLLLVLTARLKLTSTTPVTPQPRHPSPYCGQTWRGEGRHSSGTPPLPPPSKY